MNVKKIFRTGFLMFFTILLLIITNEGKAKMPNNNDREEIKSIIEKAYIEGIHTTQDESTIKSGFHKEFEMLVYKDNGMEKVTLEMWPKRIEQLKKDNPDLWNKKTRYDSMQINITGYAASVQFDVYKGDTFFSTDYMLLYKFQDGWKIVSKIFTIKRD